MDPAAEHALRLLEEIGRRPRETGPVILSASYLGAVERVEGLPESQPGTDKTWVFELRRRSRALLARARQVR
jgi:hypothetical protein